MDTIAVETITVEELAASVGSERVSGWVKVTQTMIDTFAEATGDHQFIHVNPELAAKTPFGGTIAHGFLSLSLMPMLAKQTGAPAVAGMKMGVNYGGNKVRFITRYARASGSAAVSSCSASPSASPACGSRSMNIRSKSKARPSRP